MRPRGETFPALTAQERIATAVLDDVNGLEGGMVVDLQPGGGPRSDIRTHDWQGVHCELRIPTQCALTPAALFMPSGWWREVRTAHTRRTRVERASPGLPC